MMDAMGRCIYCGSRDQMTSGGCLNQSCLNQRLNETPNQPVLPMTHDLKTWPGPFEALVSGLKRFEIRNDDRGFQVGHMLNLREWDPGTAVYSGRWMLFQVTHIERGPNWGLPADVVVMGIKVPDLSAYWNRIFEGALDSVGTVTEGGVHQHFVELTTDIYLGVGEADEGEHEPSVQDQSGEE
jgi:hypothetical protein